MEKNDEKEEKAPTQAIAKCLMGNTHAEVNSQGNRPAYLPHVPLSQSNFVCEVCKRGYPLAKKYAKNQCQTCYKKIKKRQIRVDEYEMDARREEASDRKASPRSVRNWSGRCPTCQREGVKHYARGCCTMCYRKEMKKLKRLMQDARSIDDSNSQLNG